MEDQMSHDPEQHEQAHEHEQHAHMGTPAATSKFTLSFHGIDWQKEVMNAIEILKLNKTKMHEVAKDEKATTVGMTFIIVPQILAIIISMIMVGGYVGYAQGTYIIQLITPFLFIYALHVIAVKFFQGKGDLIPLFRVISYASVISILVPVVLLLGWISWGLMGLMSLVLLVVGVWQLIVAYTILTETHHMTSQNTIITMVIAIVVVGIIMYLLQRLLFPNPWEEMASKLNDYTRYFR